MDRPDGTVGTLYVVATPIGHLEDITFRAVKTLTQVSLIAAEDTRHTQRLLSHYQITTRLISCHEHNELKQVPAIIRHLESGEDAALVSDAGTPCISDPGYRLIRQVSQNNIRVIPIPGCSAAIAGLSVSGLPTDSFLFLGFLPKKNNRRKAVLQEHARTRATLILYESPRRIIQLCDEIELILGSREVCLAREITKQFEEYLRGPVGQIKALLGQRPGIKGECTLLVDGCTHPSPAMDDEELAALIRSQLGVRDWKTSDLARSISDETGMSKKAVYDRIVEIRKPS